MVARILRKINSGVYFAEKACSFSFVSREGVSTAATVKKICCFTEAL